MEGGVCGWGGGVGGKGDRQRPTAACVSMREVWAWEERRQTGEREKQDLFVNFCMWRLSRAPDVPRVD